MSFSALSHRYGRTLGAQRDANLTPAVEPSARFRAGGPPSRTMRRMKLTVLALTEAVKARALALGFERVAIGPADAIPHAQQFTDGLAAGYGEGMDWIGESRDIRLEPARLLPGVKSAVVVALHYGPREDDPSWDVVSRYARGADYHNVMRPRLHVLRDYLIEAGGADSRASLD